MHNNKNKKKNKQHRANPTYNSIFILIQKINVKKNKIVV